MFEKGNADWLSEIQSVFKQYNSTIHHSFEMTPIEASRKVNEKRSIKICKTRVKHKPKFKLGQLIRTADIKKVFSKRDSTNCSYNLYTITEVIRDTISSYRIDYLPERYNENLLLPTKLSLEENNQVMKE